ncbi:micrococcal nuclease [Nannocystis exedens]|uniref:Micrococcal nuclease n=1 Tax=Nannocystis exedens TaxID=54 RepID=A0A1I1WIR3_9BACT|nr:thermonuclease family protein [Nannocystis exedens]PCC67751.1 thermonuclease [Nannocystis exedens]SFD94889.1 micrococcal nuclease [Nannocystis exedens]
MPLTRLALILASLPLLAFGTGACEASEASDADGDDAPLQSKCGPTAGRVASVIDGDTIVLESGEKVRYLLVDTPEITNGKRECFGLEARDFNAEYVLGQEIELTYDVECADTYGRLLAYVDVPDGEINSLLIARGYACVLDIPPNGEDRAGEFMAMQRAAQDQKAGLWGMCGDVCGP